MSNQENNERKPIYKEWWFWVVVALFVLIILCLGTVENDKTQQTSESQNTSTNIENTIAQNTLSETIVEKKEVVMIDFSQMTKEEIKNWCTTNKLICDISEQYSDTITKGMFISQSVQPNSTAYEGDEITVIYSLGKQPTMGERNALETANDYLRVMAFSYTGLIEQLEYEGYSKQEATYGADNCEADWNEQAAEMAKQYIDTMSFSRSGLIEQLEYEGFTKEQAEYGASSVGY